MAGISGKSKRKIYYSVICYQHGSKTMHRKGCNAPEIRTDEFRSKKDRVRGCPADHSS